MEGRLRRIGEQAWEGELHGYVVHIAQQCGRWHVWLMPDWHRTRLGDQPLGLVVVARVERCRAEPVEGRQQD